ncbi:hypothetical protein Tco_0005185 [Tanacetum coccineum]
MANKHSIMTREMVESFCDNYYIPDEVHPAAPGRDMTITQFPEGKVGVYTRLFDYCGYRIPLTKFCVSVLKYFLIHISQLSPFGAARISHFEVLTRVLDLGSSVAVFRTFYTRIYSDGLFSFAKRSLSAPSCLSKPPDSIKNWADHFFWVDARVFPISVPLYTGGVLEKDPAPHLTAHMGLLDYIRTADPRKVQAVEVQKGEEQVTLLESTKHCFVSLDAPAAVHQASGSGSGAGSKAYAPSAGETIVAEEDVIPAGTYVDLVDPEGDLPVVKKGDAAQKQPEKAKRKKLLKQSDPLPAKRLRIDHPSLASGTGGKSLASLRRTLPEGSLILGSSSSADVHTHVTVQSSRVADAPVYTAADIVTSSRGKTLVVPTSDVGGSSQPETSEESADSFYETAVLNSEDAKRWYIPRWNITNDALLDDGFSCRTLVDRVAPPGFFSTLRNIDYDQLFEEFNVGAARQICLGSEVRKLRGKYDARGVLLREKDAEIARLKSLVKEKDTESAKVLHLRDQKDTDISLLDSRASYLKSALDDSQAACGEARNLISSLSSERDGLASEVSTLHSAFCDFKEKMEAQQEEQAQELYNHVAELEAHVMDVSGRLEGEFYPAYLTALAGRRWLLTHGMELAMVTVFVSLRVPRNFGSSFSRAWIWMQEGLAAGHEHGIAGTPLSAVVAYNPETAENNYLDASLPEATHLQPCLEQLFVPIYHADLNAVAGETSLSFALLNVHTRAEGAKKHAAALRSLMEGYCFSHPLSSQSLLGEANTSVVISCVEDLDTDEDLGSVVFMPQLEDPCFETLP